MKKTKIGIPKALLYYRYSILWKTFFTNLNCEIITSGDTNKEILELGKKYSIDESCLSSKIYIGHVATLVNKCDYILVPRVENYGKKEKVCVKFNGIYDIVKNLFPTQKLLEYNIEKNKNPFMILSFIKLGKKITNNYFKILISYIKAIIKHKEVELKLEQKQKEKLNSKNKKLLIVSHPYNIYDNYIGTPIIKKLENMQIDLIYADKLNKKISKKHSKELSPTLYWTYSKELIGSINYYKNKIEGIIFITTFPCGPDSLVNELILRKIKDIPMLNIIIDELTSSTGLDTRLESFIDIIKERSEDNE